MDIDKLHQSESIQRELMKREDQAIENQQPARN